MKKRPSIWIGGQRFGRLLVVGLPARSRSGYLWPLLCDCGTRLWRSLTSLERSTTPSCGCLATERLIGPPLAPGQRFGALTVVSRWVRCCWICRCDCGETRIAQGSRLKRGDVTCCGACARGRGLRSRAMETQTVILAALHAAPFSTYADVATMVEINHRFADQHLRKLLRRGLVSRTHSGARNRAGRYDLTDLGRARILEPAQEMTAQPSTEAA